MTNADKIRAMTDEELAKYMSDHNFNCPPTDCPGYDDCSECWVGWLKQDVTDNG